VALLFALAREHWNVLLTALADLQCKNASGRLSTRQQDHHTVQFSP